MKVDLLVVVMTALIGGIVKVELALVVESVLKEVVLTDLLEVVTSVVGGLVEAVKTLAVGMATALVAVEVMVGVEVEVVVGACRARLPL